jgi:hypothetical protein
MKILRVTLYALVSVLSSCVADRYVSISANYPPSITFNANHTTILVINTFDFGQLNLKSEKKLATIKGGAYASINYAVVKLSQLPNVRLINLTDSNRVYLTTDSLNVLTKKYNADYILALNTFNAFFDADNFQTYNSDKKETVKTADYSMKVIAKYTLYDKDGEVYKQLNGFTRDYHSTEQVPGVLLATALGPGVKNNSSVVNQSAIHATDNALQCFFVSTTVRNRKLYSKGNFNDIASEIVANNFSRADSLLRPLLNDADADLSAKAAYDLAVICEAKGDIKGAREMAQLSIEKSDNTNARILLDELAGNVIASTP